MIKLELSAEERRQICMAAVKHFNMIADPATHSKKEVMVSVIWSWEQNLAVLGDVQLMCPGNRIAPNEANFVDSVAILAHETKLERVATFRQLQAISCTLANMTSGHVTLDTFLPPAELHVRPVQQGEARVVREEQGPLNRDCQIRSYEKNVSQFAQHVPFFRGLDSPASSQDLSAHTCSRVEKHCGCYQTASSLIY